MSYRDDLDRYILPALGQLRLSQLDAATLDTFYARLRAAGGKNSQPLSASKVREDFYRDLLAKALARPRAELFSDEATRAELATDAEPWLLARALELSSVGEASLTALEQAVGGLARSYPSTPPMVLARPVLRTSGTWRTYSVPASRPPTTRAVPQQRPAAHRPPGLARPAPRAASPARQLRPARRRPAPPAATGPAHWPARPAPAAGAQRQRPAARRRQRRRPGAYPGHHRRLM